MDYEKHYQLLVNRARHRIPIGYTEKHHVVPKCLGGNDEDDNLVRLYPEEHYVAHQLLLKMYPNNDDLIFAASMMVVNRPSNKLYGWLKRKHSVAAKRSFVGTNNSQYGTRWITDGVTDKKINKADTVPVGWKPGRAMSINWIKNGRQRSKKVRTCPHCHESFTSNRKRKYCCWKCFLDDNRENIAAKVSAARIGKRRSAVVKEKISNGMRRYHSTKTL